jgi:hypothetical protein
MLAPQRARRLPHLLRAPQSRNRGTTRVVSMATCSRTPVARQRLRSYSRQRVAASTSVHSSCWMQSAHGHCTTKRIRAVVTSGRMYRPAQGGNGTRSRAALQPLSDRTFPVAHLESWKTVTELPIQIRHVIHSDRASKIRQHSVGEMQKRIRHCD